MIISIILVSLYENQLLNFENKLFFNLSVSGVIFLGLRNNIIELQLKSF